jgi:hypothetical protein
VKTDHGHSRVTLMGCVAIILRYTTARRVETNSWDRGPMA